MLILKSTFNFFEHPEAEHLEPLFYDVRYDLPEDIIRNKRDSRFFPGNQPAGVKGITKELLEFIKNRVNPLGFEIDEVRNKIEDEYSNNIVEVYELEYYK